MASKIEYAGQRAEVWSWLPESEIEPGAMTQIKNVGALPCAVHVAVMPDSHQGYGMPIGCALATTGAVVPYAVGVDIGCGMIAVKTSIPADGVATADIREALIGIFNRVPVGQPTSANRNAGSHAERQESTVLRQWIESRGHLAPALLSIRDRAEYQLGSLGGGNHFIEIQTDGEHLWLMLHSGSRAFGKAVCDHYHKIAAKWCERYYTALPDKDLAFLSLDTQDGRDYLIDMGFALRYAEESRERMATASMEAMRGVFGDFEEMYRLQTHHNYAAVERWRGREAVIHRKGAVSTLGPVGSAGAVGVALTPRSKSDSMDAGEVSPAKHPASTLAGAMVTIPGSMETGSYIGEGIPNHLALNTCAHGAGRKLGRNAVKKLNVGVDIKSEMEARGLVLVTPEGSDALDEAGRAYKDIESVMGYQSELVRPLLKLSPLGTVKG